MKVAIYVRVSTSQQVDRDSLTTQQERLKNLVAARGLTLHKVYADLGVSAKNTNRPLLEELLKDAEHGLFQYVYVTRLDRVSRSLKDLLKLIEFFEERNIKLVSLTENIDTDGAMGRFVLNLLGAVAQLEREIDAERVSTDMHHRAAKGKWNGGQLPFGYLTQEKYIQRLLESGASRAQAVEAAARDMPEAKKLYPVEEEAALVREIFEIYSRLKSLRKVVTELNRQGKVTRRGAWTTTSVRRLLTNQTYAGFVIYGKRKVDPRTGKPKPVGKANWKVVPGEHEALISLETFEQTQELLKSRAKKPTKAKHSYLLSGLLKCGYCGGMLYGYTIDRKSIAYTYYRCGTQNRKGAAACRGLNVDGKVIEKIVVDSILELSENVDFLSDKERLLRQMREAADSENQRTEAERKQLAKRERELRGRRDVLLDKLETGLIDDEVFKERFASVKAELDELMAVKAELAARAEGGISALTTVETTYGELLKLKDEWPALDDEARRARLQVIVKHVIVKKDGDTLKLDMTLYVDSLKQFELCDARTSMRHRNKTRREFKFTRDYSLAEVTGYCSPSPQTLGQFIRKSRVERGWMLKELAGRLDCDQFSIIGWENDRRIPGLRILKRINDVLDVPPELMRETVAAEYGLSDAASGLLWEFDRISELLGERKRDWKKHPEALKAWRLSLFMPHTDFAEVIEVDPSTVLAWERG